MESLLLCLTSFAVCGAGALLPFVNTEIYLVGASALAPRAMLVPLVVAGSVGAMAGKVLLYLAGRGIVKLPRGRMQQRLEAMQARMEARPHVAKLIYAVSSIVGLPPFYVTTIAAGAVEMNFAFFLLAGLAGRLIRFGAFVALPHLGWHWFGG
jgi:membrane protein YqaA with SNARE-associated domain